jgi:hypothetical protein
MKVATEVREEQAEAVLDSLAMVAVLLVQQILAAEAAAAEKIVTTVQVDNLEAQEERELSYWHTQTQTQPQQ